MATKNLQDSVADYVRAWMSATEAVKEAKRELDRAKTELDNRVNALGKYTLPDNAAPGEPFHLQIYGRKELPGRSKPPEEGVFWLTITKNESEKGFFSDYSIEWRDGRVPDEVVEGWKQPLKP